RACQRIEAQWGGQLQLQDLRRLGRQASAEVQRLQEAHFCEGFDLQQGPLWRALLLQVADEEHVLLLALHHVIADGWSLGILIRELGALYASRVRGQADTLATPRLQYADYAQWQRQWLQGEVLQKQLQYWRERLQGAPAVLELPTDHVRPRVASFRGG